MIVIAVEGEGDVANPSDSGDDETVVYDLEDEKVRDAYPYPNAETGNLVQYLVQHPMSVRAKQDLLNMLHRANFNVAKLPHGVRALESISDFLPKLETEEVRLNQVIIYFDQLYWDGFGWA
jgi:hypothetical protein